MGDPVLGCTMEDGGPKMAGGWGGEGGPNNGGNQNDGVAVGWGTQFWVAPWTVEDSE